MLKWNTCDPHFLVKVMSSKASWVLGLNVASSGTRNSSHRRNPKRTSHSRLPREACSCNPGDAALETF